MSKGTPAPYASYPDEDVVSSGMRMLLRSLRKQWCPSLC